MEQLALDQILAQIGRFSHSLGVQKVAWEEVAEKCARIQQALSPLVKYRRTEYLVPVVVYIYLKIHGFSVDKEQIAALSGVTCQEISEFLRSLAAWKERHALNPSPLAYNSPAFNKT